MRVALGLVGVDRGGLDRAVGLGGGQFAGDLQRALELRELAAHGGNARVVDGKPGLGVGLVNDPDAAGDDGAGGEGAHGVQRFLWFSGLR